MLSERPSHGSSTVPSSLMLGTLAVSRTGEGRLCGLKCCCKRGDKNLMFYCTLVLSLCIGFLGLFQVGMGMFIRVEHSSKDSGNNNVLDAYLSPALDSEEANVYFYALMTKMRVPVESSFETAYVSFRERFSEKFRELADTAWTVTPDEDPNWEKHAVIKASWLQGFQEYVKKGDIDRHADLHFKSGFVAAETIELIEQDWMVVMGFGCTVFALGVSMLMSLWKRFLAPPLFIISLLFGIIVVFQYGEISRWPLCADILSATGLSALSVYRVKDIHGGQVVYDDLHEVTVQVYEWIEKWSFPTFFFYTACLILVGSLVLLVETTKLIVRRVCKSKDFSLGAMEFLSDQAEREKGDDLIKKPVRFGDLAKKGGQSALDCAKTPKSKFVGAVSAPSSPQPQQIPPKPAPTQHPPPTLTNNSSSSSVFQAGTNQTNSTRNLSHLATPSYSVLPYQHQTTDNNQGGPKHNPRAPSYSRKPSYSQMPSFSTTHHMPQPPSLLDRGSGGTDPQWNQQPGPGGGGHHPDWGGGGGGPTAAAVTDERQQSFGGGPGGPGPNHRGLHADSLGPLPNHQRRNYGSASSYGGMQLFGGRGSPSTSCQPLGVAIPNPNLDWGTAIVNQPNGGQQPGGGTGTIGFRGGTASLPPRKHRQSVPAAMPSARNGVVSERFRRNSAQPTNIRRTRQQQGGRPGQQRSTLAKAASQPNLFGAQPAPGADTTGMYKSHHTNYHNPSGQQAMDSRPVTRRLSSARLISPFPRQTANARRFQY